MVKWIILLLLVNIAHDVQVNINALSFLREATEQP